MLSSPILDIPSKLFLELFNFKVVYFLWIYNSMKRVYIFFFKLLITTHIVLSFIWI